MRIITPTILLAHWIGIFIYYTVMRRYPSEWYNYSWSVYYFSINNLAIINYGLMFAFADKDKLGPYANQFVLVDIFFTLVLAFTILLQNAEIISNTYGFYIAILGMIITTILIVYNGIKYGYHNEHENE